MFPRAFLATSILAVLALSPGAPALADGEIQLSHAKALAGNVTPGDPPGYPIILSQPGIFKLASNLFVAADKIGITVTSPNVTIDLNGFTMQGSNVAWYGIAGGVDSVIITNGIITRFEFDGINGTGDHWVVENVQVLGNGRNGIDINGGRFHRIHDTTVAGNGATGIDCQGCLIAQSIVASNGAYGIELGGGTVVGNYIFDNNNEGLVTGVFGGGFAHNTFVGNNGGAAGSQVDGPIDLHPNLCVDVAC